MLNKTNKLRQGALLLAACTAAWMLVACSAAEDRIPGDGQWDGIAQEMVQEENGTQAETSAAGGQNETVSTCVTDAAGQQAGSQTEMHTQQQNGQGTEKQTGKQTQEQTQDADNGTTTQKTAAAAGKPVSTTRKPTMTTTVTTKRTTATTRTTASSPASENVSDVQQEVLRLVNLQREKAGKQPLTMDAKLSQAAGVRAAEIVRLFSHDRPDGTSCFTAMTQAGVSYMAAGENIAAGQRTAAEVMESWMNSQGHRENILSDSFGRLGVGYTVVNGRAYWVQLFAD